MVTELYVNIFGLNEKVILHYCLQIGRGKSLHFVKQRNQEEKFFSYRPLVL